MEEYYIINKEMNRRFIEQYVVDKSELNTTGLHLDLCAAATHAASTVVTFLNNRESLHPVNEATSDHTDLFGKTCVIDLMETYRRFAVTTNKMSLHIKLDGKWIDYSKILYTCEEEDNGYERYFILIDPQHANGIEIAEVTVTNQDGTHVKYAAVEFFDMDILTSFSVLSDIASLAVDLAGYHD